VNEDQFKCPLDHPIPNNTGFPPNFVVAELLRKTPGDVNRGQMPEKLKQNLQKIEMVISEFENKYTRYSFLINSFDYSSIFDCLFDMIII